MRMGNDLDKLLTSRVCTVITTEATIEVEDKLPERWDGGYHGSGGLVGAVALIMYDEIMI